MIVQKVSELKKIDPNVKIVIFSQWANILSYIEMAMISTNISYRSKLEEFHKTIQQFKVPLSCAMRSFPLFHSQIVNVIMLISFKGSWFECHVPVAAIVIWIQRIKSYWSDSRVSGWTNFGSGRRIASYWTHSSNRTNKVRDSDIQNRTICFGILKTFIQNMIMSFAGKRMFIDSSSTIQSKSRFTIRCPKTKMVFGRQRNAPSRIWPSSSQHRMSKPLNHYPSIKLNHKYE